jgi:transcriptional regulator with AAA-type ATPase domain/predicted ATPase
LTTFSDLLGESPEILALRERAGRLLDRWSAARRPPPVFIQGETGTGKGLLARLLHRASPRANEPFISVNCAAVPETLIEAELFGYERGAFTDARQPKPGLFQLAHRGTLFLDEVGLLTTAAQGKLLSALEEGVVRRLGATRSEPVDVWVIAATNEALDERRFRQDLFHRLAVFTLELPPLRSRTGDILLLAEHFLAQACADYGLPPRRLASDARAALTTYTWSGNVRELGNVIERAALLVDAPVLTAADLALQTAPRSRAPAPDPSASPAPSERDELERALNETSWNVTRTAAMLGVTRNTVRARIARAGLQRPDGTPPPDAPAAALSLTPTRPAPLGLLPKTTYWESRRLTFLRVSVTGGADVEIGQRVATQLELAADKLREFRGRIEGVSPRAVLAVFGVDPSEEPTLLAGHGALALQNAARRLESYGPETSFGVGLHTQEVLVREGDGTTVLDADATRRAWTTLEDTLEHGPAGAIVATPTAAALLRRRFILSRLPGETSAYRVEKLWHAANPRGPRGPMVGRLEELALLTSRLRGAASGRGHSVDIVGEAGIGKSRLLAELVAAAPVVPVRYLEGRCLPAETRTPFYPLLQIARLACGIEEADPSSVVLDRVNRAAADVGLDPGSVVVELGYLLGGTSDAPEAGPALTKRLFTALERFFVAMSRRRPLLIVVEDLHWIDPTSEAWLAAFAASLAEAPILLVATYRSEYKPPWAGRPGGLILPLSPLGDAESMVLIRRVLEAGLSSEQLESEIQTKAEGNPLFLEELSLAALERGDGTLSERIPATVEDTVASRLARLEGRQRRVLRAAAVIGREFSLRLLHEVSDVPEDELEGMLRQFHQADFLSQSAVGESRYAFKHALVQEAAYAGLSDLTRCALHVRALGAIEKAYPDRILDFVERLAHHAVRGDDRVRAIRYLLLAGQKAGARSALAESLGHLHRGLELLAARPASLDRDRQEAEFQVAIGNVLRASKGSAVAETEQAYGRARALLQRAGAPSHLGPALVGEWASHLLKARLDSAQLVAEEVFASSEHEKDPLLRAVGHRGLGMTALYRADFETVRQHLEQGIAVYRPEEHHARAVAEYGGDPHIYCLAYLGRALWCLGYPDQALARNRQAVAEAETWGAALGVAMTRGMLTLTHQLRREVAETLEAGGRALAHASEVGIDYWQAQSAILLAWAEAESGLSDPDRQLVELRKSIEQYRATGTRLALSWFSCLLAEVCRASGRAREGLDALDEALAHARETGERYQEAEIHRLRGELLLADQGRAAVPAARACFEQAQDVARRQSARAWELRAATSLARLLHQEHDGASARAVLGPIYAWFTEGFETADLRDARALLESLST